MFNPLPFIKTIGIMQPIWSLNYEKSFGIGDLKGAYSFIDFLSKSGIQVWEIENIHPNIPISSAFALDDIYIDITNIVDLQESKLRDTFIFQESFEIDIQKVRDFKIKVLQEAFNNFYDHEFVLDTLRAKAFRQFQEDNRHWLNEYSLFCLASSVYGTSLENWPKPLVLKEWNSLTTLESQKQSNFLFVCYLQWISHLQWVEFKDYANKNGISILLQESVFLPPNSCDIWANNKLFEANEYLKPMYNLGVGGYKGEIKKINAVSYNWKSLEESGYKWWIERLTHISTYADGIKLSPINGLFSCFKSKGNERFKEEKAPGKSILNLIIKELEDKNLKHICIDGIDNAQNNDLRKELGINNNYVFIQDCTQIFNQIPEDSIIQSSYSNQYSLPYWWRYTAYENKRYLLENLKEQQEQPSMVNLNQAVQWKILDKITSKNVHASIFPLQDVLEPQVLEDGGKLYKVNVKTQDLQTDNALISKLSDLKKTITDSDLICIPKINDDVVREYYLDEDIYLWILSKDEIKLRAITNLPMETNQSTDLKELPFQKIENSNNGFLYRLILRSSRPGFYILSIHKEENTIRSLEKKIALVIRKEKKTY